jgi:hypothetical protein
MKRTDGFRGPSLILLAIVHILLFVANLVAAAVLRHGGAPYVNPYATGEAISRFFAQNPRAVQVGSFLIFGSAVPLGIFAATAVSRLRFLRVRAAGTNIALLGGFAAAGALALSGLFGWVLSLPEVYTSASLAKGLYFLCFLFGGASFAVAFGLMAAGISITGYFSRLLPGWLAGFGVLIALAGELSSLSLVTYSASYLIPITRYLGLIWLLMTAVKLSTSRRPQQATLVTEKAA